MHFTESEEAYPKVTIFASGLYPLLHYYNSNLHISNSWQQLLFMLILCFVIPFMLLWVSKYVFELKILHGLKPYRLAMLNFVVFLVLIGVFVFDFKKKATAMIILIACVIAMLLYRYLKKIVVIQFIIAVVSLVTLIPVLFFALNQDNGEWANVPTEFMKIQLKKMPNIFVIQPDGYVNRSLMHKPPYDIDNSNFDDFIESKGFINYDDFRSNYYSTMTSNASLFSMKHHYYSSNYQKSGKTFNANQAIIGKYNNVLTILKANKYRTNLITDNSYFLIDRTNSNYDFCNVKPHQVSFINTGSVDTDILNDLKSVLDTTSHSRNFFFIEKTIPSHINYSSSTSLGLKGEWQRYYDRLQEANAWLKSLIETINRYDNEAMIVLVSDHGGYVGMEYTLEAVERKMDSVEVLSSFSSLLAIKWPTNFEHNKYEFKSSVNLFRTLINGMAETKVLNDDLDNGSYIPLKENGIFQVYNCVNGEGEVNYVKVE